MEDSKKDVGEEEFIEKEDDNPEEGKKKEGRKCYNYIVKRFDLIYNYQGMNNVEEGGEEIKMKENPQCQVDEGLSSANKVEGNPILEEEST